MAPSKAQPQPKTAFITGASGGIGEAAAMALKNAGYRVIGTSRSAKPDEVRDGVRMIPDIPLAAYDTGRAKYFAALQRAMTVADTAESVAETILKAARQVAFARRFAPRSLFDKILRSQFGLA